MCDLYAKQMASDILFSSILNILHRKTQVVFFFAMLGVTTLKFILLQNRFGRFKNSTKSCINKFWNIIFDPIEALVEKKAMTHDTISDVFDLLLYFCCFSLSISSEVANPQAVLCPIFCGSLCRTW